MTAVAIICEYNPFHSGHAYHIDEAKRLSGADFAIAIMSGFFVQRAEPAIVSPQTRATAAISSGIDAVIEMPVIYSVGAGNVFAEGAVGIISRIPAIKYLAMGVEDDGNILEEIAAAQSAESETYRQILKNALHSGLSYPAAVTKATEATLCGNVNYREILTKPNNILAIEYLKAIRKSGADIRPIFVKREGNGYNDTSACGKFISATAARLLMSEKRYDELKPYIPAKSFDILKNEYENYPVDNTVYEALTIHALRTRDISQAADCAEGLDIKIRECATSYASLERIFQASKSKRYTMSRIRRICLQTLLGITESAERNENVKPRLTAIKKARTNCIKHLTGVAIQNNDLTDGAKIDGVAGGIYSLITHRDGNMFWNRKLLIL